MDLELALFRLRTLVHALPETSEKLSHGAPTWWGGRKTFACLHDGHYDDGRPSVWIKLPEGRQAALIDRDPARFFRPKYLGPAGWVGLRLRADTDWVEAEALLEEGWRSVVTQRAKAALTARRAAPDPA